MHLKYCLLTDRILPRFIILLFPYIDTNECLDNTCQNGVCINHEGSFQCKCFEGYHHDSNGICVDINECEEVHYHLSYIKSGWAELGVQEVL